MIAAGDSAGCVFVSATGMAAVGRRPTERKRAEIREEKQKKHLYCARRHAIIRGQTEERKT